MKYLEIVNEVPHHVALTELAEALDKMLEIPILTYEKIREDAKDPTKAHESDMCYDVYATSEIITTPDYIEYSLGLKFHIPEGYGLELYPRSSVSNYHFVLANSVGQIDTDYRGELKVRFKVVTLSQLEAIKTYVCGDKIAQIKLVKKDACILVEGKVSEDTTRSSGGFGSSGK